MIYNINGAEITIDDNLIAEYERVTGCIMTQEEIECMAHGAVKNNKSVAEIEEYTIQSIESYIKVGRRLPEIIRKIEAGEIETDEPDEYDLVYIIDGQEIVINNKLMREYERAMGCPLTNLKVKSMYDTVMDGNSDVTDLNNEILKLILEYIAVAKDMPEIIKKIETGDINHE